MKWYEVLLSLSLIGAALGLLAAIAVWASEAMSRNKNPRAVTLDCLGIFVLGVLWWIALPVLMIRLLVRNTW